MPRSEKRKLAVAEMDAELRSAWTLRLRSGQAREGARLHTNLNPLQKMPNAYKNIRL